jgi:hypothetical protein
LLDPTQGCEHALLDLAVLAAVFHDLQVLSVLGLLDSEEHGARLMRDTINFSNNNLIINQVFTTSWHYVSMRFRLAQRQSV